MDNYLQEGCNLTLTAPGGGVVSGTGYLIGSIFVVAVASADATESFVGCTCGVFTLPKTSAQAWTEGQKIYWDNGNARCDSDSTVGMLIGVATAVAANPSSTGSVRLNGGAPSTAEGAQGAIVALTDNTGGSGTHDDTLADGLTTTALVADNGGGTADGTVAAQAAPVTLTDNTGGSGTHDDTLADGLTATAPGAITDYTAVVNMTNPVTKTEGETMSAALATLESEVTALQVTVAACVTDLGVQNQNASDLAQKLIELVTLAATAQDNLKEVTTKIGTLITDVTAQNQNDSDLAQKILEIRTALIAAGILTA